MNKLMNKTPWVFFTALVFLAACTPLEKSIVAAAAKQPSAPKIVWVRPSKPAATNATPSTSAAAPATPKKVAQPTPLASAVIEPAPIGTLPSGSAEASWSYRLVNATGLPGAVVFTVQGQPLMAVGYQSGEVTGTLLPPGPEFTITASHADCPLTHQTVVKMKATQQLSVVAFRRASISADDKPAIQFSVVEASSVSNTRRVEALSYCLQREGTAAKDLEVSFGKKVVQLPYGEPKQFSLQLSGAQQGTAVPIKVGSVTLGSLDLERRGNTAVVLYTDLTTGDVRCVEWFNNRDE